MREISVKQEKLIAYLLTEKTIDEACRKANVAVTTYWRWMQNENFLKQYRQTRRGILENTIAKLQSITFQAIGTLERNLNCENPATEIRAAQIIIEQSIKGLETLGTLERIETLEILVERMEH